ncbi:hypothetical protein C1Y40_00124 [Mycobacterium talmoniae]|uniref:Uncharacterized protein n=1 Tax=Mycobacterium talmoniae TaxID=1858794 RepID=A0A2S8BSJ5_9MYCO|nr:hypothetical protein C1Y40_00124 [Mycobacterium talmoniae]
MGHPEGAGRMRTVVVLDPLQQMLHPGVQQRAELRSGQRGFDRFADRDRDRHLGAIQLLGVILGPDPLRAPDDVRHDRHAGRDRHPGRAALELLELKAAADRGLGVDADQLAGLEVLAGGLERRGAVVAVHRDVAAAAHDRAGDAVIEHLLFGHEPHLAAQTLLVGRQAGEGEVEVAGVVDRDDGPAGLGQVLHSGDRELQPLQTPGQPRALDDRPVYRFHKSSD